MPSQKQKHNVVDNLAIWLKKHPNLSIVSSLVRGKQSITLDYPVNPKPRYGFGKEPHPQLLKLINSSRDKYESHLNSFTKFKENFLDIKLDQKPDEPTPYWKNSYLPGLDAISIYSFIATKQPNIYMEIGSGISTRFAKQAILDHNLSTRIISIDPSPRAEIDSICDAVIRKSVETVDLSVFNQLDSNDILFVDNSHQSFPNSDVTVFFLDILPNLKKKVLLGIHDIFLPFDYPQSVALNYYSEQYLLASWLLGGGNGSSIELASYFASQDDQLKNLLSPIYSEGHLKQVQSHGGAFWISI